MAGGPTQDKKGPDERTAEAMKARNPFRFQWGSSNWKDFKIVFPVEVMLTSESKLYVVARRHVPQYPLPSLLGIKLFGPIDPEQDVGEQLKEVGPFMKFDQEEGDKWKVVTRINGLGKAFSARVDLNEFKANFREALKAMEAGDMDALRKVCPEPNVSG